MKLSFTTPCWFDRRTEVKTIPYVPISHPFVERLIGTIRRDYLDQVLFWNASDLERKLTVADNVSNAGDGVITNSPGTPF